VTRRLVSKLNNKHQGNDDETKQVKSQEELVQHSGQAMPVNLIVIIGFIDEAVVISGVGLGRADVREVFPDPVQCGELLGE